MTEAIRQGDIPGVQLRRRRHFAGIDAPTLWRWLTEDGKLGCWLADEAVARPGPSGGLELRSQGAAREVGETVAHEPPHLWVLAFRRDDWNVSTRLELTLSEDSAGVELSVLQNGFEHLPLSDGLTLWETYRRRWTEALDRLGQAVASPNRVLP